MDKEGHCIATEGFSAGECHGQICIYVGPLSILAITWQTDLREKKLEMGKIKKL